MKMLFAPLTLCAMALLTTPASAELILYKGSGTANYIGDNRNARVPFKLYVVVDSSTLKVAEVVYLNLLGTKVYSTSMQTNLTAVQVTGSNGKVYTALTRQLECEVEDGADIEQVFAQGANSTLTLGNGAQVSFPKTLKAKQQIYTEESGTPSLISGSASFSFDKNRTLSHNNAGNTVEQAVAQLAAALEGKGYTQEIVTLKNAGSVFPNPAPFAE